MMGEKPTTGAAIAGPSDLAIAAELIAPRLGLEPEQSMTELRRGAVRQTTERGSEEDAGRFRVTFRYRRRRCRVVVDTVQATVVAL